jgi:hypothetical protein
MAQDFEARIASALAGADPDADQKLLKSASKTIAKSRKVIEQYLGSPNESEYEQVSAALRDLTQATASASLASPFVAEPERYKHRQRAPLNTVDDVGYWATGGPLSTGLLMLNPGTMPVGALRASMRGANKLSDQLRRNKNAELSYDPRDYEGWQEELGYVPAGGEQAEGSGLLGNLDLGAIEVPDWVKSLLVGQAINLGGQAALDFIAEDMGGADGLFDSVVSSVAGAGAVGYDKVSKLFKNGEPEWFTKLYTGFTDFLNNIETPQWVTAAYNGLVGYDWDGAGKKVQKAFGDVLEYVESGGLDDLVMNVGGWGQSFALYDASGIAALLATVAMAKGDTEGAAQALAWGESMVDSAMGPVNAATPAWQAMMQQENTRTGQFGDMMTLASNNYLQTEAMNAELLNQAYQQAYQQAMWLQQNQAQGPYAYGYGPGGNAEYIASLGGRPFEPIESQYVQLPNIPVPPRMSMYGPLDETVRQWQSGIPNYAPTSEAANAAMMAAWAQPRR